METRTCIAWETRSLGTGSDEVWILLVDGLAVMAFSTLEAAQAEGVRLSGEGAP